MVVLNCIAIYTITYKVKKKDLFVYFTLFLIGIITRVPLLERIQSHWDGPQFSIAILRFSFEQQTPAPPGYPLYIALGKFIYIFFHNPHQALLAVSVLEAAVGSIIFYLIGRSIYNRFVGLLASTIFLTGSTFYYFSLTAYGYGLVPMTTALLAYVVYLISVKHKHIGLLLGTIFGISFGIRPQEISGTIFLFLLGFIFLSNKEKTKSLLVFLIITFLWFIPILYITGFSNYFKISGEFANSAFTPVPLNQHIELMLKGFLLSFGIASGAMLYYIWQYLKYKNNLIRKSWKIFIFFSVWILPSLLFNLFIRTDHAGYQMSYLSAFLMLISFAIWKMTAKNKILYVVVILLIASFNLYWFFYDRDPNFTKPYRITSFHYSDIRKKRFKNRQ